MLTFQALALCWSESTKVTLKMSAFESLYSGHFTLSTQLNNYLAILFSAHDFSLQEGCIFPFLANQNQLFFRVTYSCTHVQFFLGGCASNVRFTTIIFKIAMT